MYRILWEHIGEICHVNFRAKEGVSEKVKSKLQPEGWKGVTAVKG